MAPGQFEGIEHLRDAAEMLAVQDEKLRERLRVAGEEFWRAAYHYDHWPREFQEHADRIIGRILAKGTVKETVPQMDIEEASKTASDILRFMVDAERASASANGKR